MATILNLKTKNQIYADFKSFVEAALTEFSINNWEVKKLHQVIKTEDLKPCIYLQILSKNQKGAQYNKLKKVSKTSYITDYTGFDGTGFQPFNQFPFLNGDAVEIITNSYFRRFFSKQEIKIRFSATRREQLQDQTETLNGSDVLEYVKNYLQSDDGITMLAAKGYAQYRASNVQEQSFTNDDENIQLMPYFDCEYLYTDEWQKQINKLDKVQEIYKKGV